MQVSPDGRVKINQLIEVFVLFASKLKPDTAVLAKLVEYVAKVRNICRKLKGEAKEKFIFLTVCLSFYLYFKRSCFSTS